MPSIKDKSTVDAIARVFCGEGKRCKTETLKIVGYKPSYYLGGRSDKAVWGNERVIKAIAEIDAEETAKSTLTIQTVLDDLDWGIAQAKLRKPPDLSAIARLSELRGKYLSMFSETGNNAATGLSLNFTVKGSSKHAEPKTVKIG